jgi:hypothetical protein
MKKKKKSIKSFKNWLLARDSSTRIVPLEPDGRFFEIGVTEEEEEDDNKKDKK